MAEIYKTNINFHPRYLPKEIQKKVVSSNRTNNGFQVSFREVISAEDLIDTRTLESTIKPTVDFEGRFNALLSRMETIEREIEKNSPTRTSIVHSNSPSQSTKLVVGTGTEFQSPTAEFNTKTVKDVKYRIKDHITPRHMWSISFFYITTLLVSGFLSFKSMTPGNWVVLSILGINFLTIVGRDPNALLRMGNFMRDMVQITKEKHLNIEEFLVTAAQQIEIREKRKIKIGFRDFVGPVDMIVLLSVTIFMSLITGLIQDGFPNPALYGLVGTVIWGVLALVGVAQPNVEGLFEDLVTFLGGEIPLPVSKEDILRAKFLRK